MKNEIGRKITSLTLMTIMVAGGLTFAVPGMMPVAEAAHNANLFVSAENSQFDNYMSGPQVIEVVVIDPGRSDTDEAEGEPDVTVNGKSLRMVQGTDGAWYGYFADRTQAIRADEIVNDAGVAGDGLDFGSFCNNATTFDDDNAEAGPPNVTFTQTVGIAVPGTNGADGGDAGATVSGGITEACGELGNGGTAPAGDNINVIREEEALSSYDPEGDADDDNVNGQIGVHPDLWPFIQLYNLNPTGNVSIAYNAAGGTQSVTLKFDTTDGFIDVSLDRSKYPRNAQVHATITDAWLNIDPTDEDSWTFGTESGAVHYQVFNENGEQEADSLNDTDFNELNLLDHLSDLMADGNAEFTIDPNPQGTGNVLTLQDTADTQLVLDPGDAGASLQDIDDFQTAGGHLDDDQPVTLTEIGTASGIFGTYDDDDVSSLKTTDDAARGTSATFTYDDSFTILIGFEFATIDIQPADDEWNSGEEIPVVLVDADANKNSRADEDFAVYNADNIIPALKTGAPFTLDDGDIFHFVTELDKTDASAADLADVAGGIENVLTDLTSANDAIFSFDSDDSDEAIIEAFSKRAIINADQTADVDLDSTGEAGGTENQGSALIIDYNDRDLSDLKAVVLDNDIARASTDFVGFSYLNYDVRTVNQNQDNEAHAVVETDIYLIIAEETADRNADGDTDDTVDITNNAGDLDLLRTNPGDYCLVKIAEGASLQGLIRLSDDFIDAIYDDDTSNSCANILDNDFDNDENIGLMFFLDDLDTDIAIPLGNNKQPVVADFLSFGFTDDGVGATERVSNQIVRFELEETADNSNTFEGSLEYFMVNQLNIADPNLYDSLNTIGDDPTIIAIEDLTEEDAPRVTYADRGQDGVVTQISDQQDAPAHSGVVSFNSNTFKIADTVDITLEDADLNVDSELIDIFTIVTNENNEAFGTIGTVIADINGNDVADIIYDFGPLGRMLDVTFNDERWFLDEDANGAGENGQTCFTNLDNAGVSDISLEASGFTLVETDIASGIFTGNFQVPKLFCDPTDLTLDDDGDGDANDGGGTDDAFNWAQTPITTTGVDIEVNYLDFRDASGEIIEVGDSAGISANTGSVSLDRTVYPVPFGVPANFDGSTADSETTPDGRSIFPVHQTGVSATENTGANNVVLGTGEFLQRGNLVIHVRVNDPDFDISASGEDTIARARGTDNNSDNTGLVKVSVIRGSNEVILGYAGGPSAAPNRIHVGGEPNITDDVRQFGPMVEIAPDAGIFESDITVRYTDGPSGDQCPTTEVFTTIGSGSGDSGTDADDRFFDTQGNDDVADNQCILQGDILQVEYFDPEDASGNTNTVTDSATFDLRNGVLQSDKSVYIIGSDMILTLIEPDFDLDNDQAETFSLDLIEWDSDAATVTMGNLGDNVANFDPEPSSFRETGDSTGIFQTVVEIPESLVQGGGSADRLERGEEIVLEYTDWGPSGSDYVGEEDEDINLTIYTSNFGATVELDQKVYTWTDKVYITIVAPDHNFDSDLVDSIGETSTDPIKVSTREFNIDQYELVETGTDTGIFTGEVILTGFEHDADGDGKEPPRFATTSSGDGPTDGLLGAKDDDGLTVSFEFSEDETVVGSALIRWNIGEVQWLEASYPASGTGVVRIIDPDMNLDPEAVDNFTADVWSDSDSGGINLTVTETNEATGIFEGTVFFTVSNESSGHRLRVAEGDTVTAEYEDHTLPDPYTTADELDITATSLIGTVVPPLERAPAANLRTVDAFGNSLDTVSVDQQVQITADLANGQDREQAFAYLVQIQDASGVTVSLAWITGSLSPGQSFSPALSWIPAESGSYTATAFVWESVDNPTALSPPVTTTINVQ